MHFHGEKIVLLQSYIVIFYSFYHTLCNTNMLKIHKLEIFVKSLLFMYETSPNFYLTIPRDKHTSTSVMKFRGNKQDTEDSTRKLLPTFTVSHLAATSYRVSAAGEGNYCELSPYARALVI